MSDDDAIINPIDALRYLSTQRGMPLDQMTVPLRIIGTYQRQTYNNTQKLIEGEVLEWWWHRGRLSVGSWHNEEIGLYLFSVGAPAAVMEVEELIACGATTIFEVGSAGGIQSYLNIGDIVVVTEAIRDEGTSHHYLHEAVTVESAKRLRERLRSQLTSNHIAHYVGPVWTTDGGYRETRGKFVNHRNAGVLGVDMETSAVLAVAQYRGVEAASAVVISDLLSETEWKPGFDNPAIQRNTSLLVKAILDAL